MFLLNIVIRFFTLMELVVHRRFHHSQSSLPEVYEINYKCSIKHLTAKKVLNIFIIITFYIY